MSRSHQVARLLRSVTEMSQEEFAKATGISPHLVSQIEAGRMEPGRSHLQKMARKVGITLSDADEVLRHLEALRDFRHRQQQGSEDALPALMGQLGSLLAAVFHRLLALPQPAHVPRQADRLDADDLMNRLRDAPKEVRPYLVQVAEDFQTWALCERVCDESERQAARSLEEATAWAELAQEIANRVAGPDGLRTRLQGYAGLHMANVRRVAGDHDRAETAFKEAEILWEAGTDPQGLLDPARQFDLKASLRRSQRRFEEALALLEKAVAVSRAPARVLIKKGFTLEVMGEYHQAVETLLLALALLDAEGEPRLRDIVYLNLAVNFYYLGRYRDAAGIVKKVHPRVVERGDAIDLTRILWLQGCIEAGLGRPKEGLNLLAEARKRFAAEKLFYDVALCLLEEAVLLLDQDQTAKVKELAQELTVVFERKGVHREALVALRLFLKAAERERATAELARDLLRYLFRARHDESLRFNPS